LSYSRAVDRPKDEFRKALGRPAQYCEPDFPGFHGGRLDCVGAASENTINGAKIIHWGEAVRRDLTDYKQYLFTEY
jgi:hypothetical protein